jgi:hypothetical protein
MNGSTAWVTEPVMVNFTPFPEVPEGVKSFSDLNVICLEVSVFVPNVLQLTDQIVRTCPVGRTEDEIGMPRRVSSER